MTGFEVLFAQKQQVLIHLNCFYFILAHLFNLDNNICIK